MSLSLLINYINEDALIQNINENKNLLDKHKGLKKPDYC